MSCGMCIPCANAISGETRGEVNKIFSFSKFFLPSLVSSTFLWGGGKNTGAISGKVVLDRQFHDSFNDSSLSTPLLREQLFCNHVISDAFQRLLFFAEMGWHFSRFFEKFTREKIEPGRGNPVKVSERSSFRSDECSTNGRDS